jgi:ADP-ribose pyrophosphatase YjhB (NUDIX family)
LLVKQAASDEEPHWALPGGIVEDGELVSEGLVREVLEETGIEILELASLAFVLQADSLRPPRLRRSSGRETGYLATVWVFEVGAWRGDLQTRDPDGVVQDAAFVPRAEAIDRLDTVWWQGASVRYLRGRLEPGSAVLQRWHADGRVEELAQIGPARLDTRP